MSDRQEPKVIRQVVSQGKCTGPGDVTFGRSDAGTEQIGLVFDVTKGEYEGRRLAWYGTVDSDKALALVKETLVTAGWDGESSLTVLTGLGSRVVNLAIDVQLIERENEAAKPMPKLRFVNRLAQASMKNPIEGDERRTFLADLDKRIRKIPARVVKTNSARGTSPEEEAALAEAANL